MSTGGVIIAAVAIVFGSLGLIVMLARLPGEWRDGDLRPLFMMTRAKPWTRGYIHEVIIASLSFLGMGVAVVLNSRPAAAAALVGLFLALTPPFILALWNPRWLSPPWARDEEPLIDAWRKRRTRRQLGAGDRTGRRPGDDR